MNWSNAQNQNISTALLLQAFAALNTSSPVDCDNFFENFGPGNVHSINNPLVHVFDKPYERLVIYEHILHELNLADNTRYAQMHKGTPYFFISWLAFTVKDYEKAVFYMDAATSEDIRRQNTTSITAPWQSTPAAGFLLLDPNQPNMEARSIMNILATEFDTQIQRFNTVSNATLTLDLFKDNFVTPNMTNASYRSIISGLYVFVMEYVEREYMLRLKSLQGGSIEPFLIHLFKGCLVFESLLKQEYGGSQNTLGGYLSTTNARSDLEISQGAYNGAPVYQRDQPLARYTLDIVINLLPTWRNDIFSERVIATTYGIRNTAGHDLSWPVTFDEATYREIYENILNSIFWYIWKVKI